MAWDGVGTGGVGAWGQCCSDTTAALLQRGGRRVDGVGWIGEGVEMACSDVGRAQRVRRGGAGVRRALEGIKAAWVWRGEGVGRALEGRGTLRYRFRKVLIGLYLRIACFRTCRCACFVLF